MRTNTAPKILLADYQPPDYLVDNVELTFILEPEETEVIAVIRFHPGGACANGDIPLVLDGEEIELQSILLDGTALNPGQYRLDDTSLTIDQLPQGDFTLTITTKCNPAANTALSGLYRTSGIYCTQCEAQGFRRITYFPDRPDILAPYKVRIEADQKLNPVLLSNGNPGNAGMLERPGWHFAEWYDPHPKPSYLFAMVAGDLAFIEDSFTTCSNRRVALKIFVEHGKQDQCDWAMTALKASMKWDEEAFGCEYDLDIFMIVAVSDFNMGAMENKGLNVFNDKYILALPETATDADYANIEAIIAHEYFHNWTGNRITCRDWFQLCLKEGLTVFRDQEFSSDLRSRAVKRIADVKLLRMHQFPEDAGPLAHPVRPNSYVEINNFYTATVYEKGAELVRMIKTLIGEENFAAGIALYFRRHDGQAAVVEDFINCMADASGRDFSQFMRWYELAGTPQVVAKTDYDAKTATLRLELVQNVPDTPGQSNKPPHLIPLEIGLIDAEGGDMDLLLNGTELAQPVIEFSAKQQVFEFTAVPRRPVVSLNRGFSAPIRLRHDVSNHDLCLQIAKDSDPLNRWQAAQTYCLELITMAMGQTGNAEEQITGLIEALNAVITDDALEPALKAQMLSLPSETDLASHIARDINPSNIHNARNFIRKKISAGLLPQFNRLWQELRPPPAYSPDAHSAGIRALRLQVLNLITAAQKTEGAQMALGLFLNAENMTDRAGALQILAQMDVPERLTALDRFYNDFADNHLVVDKWFSFHAMWPHDAAVEKIGELMRHPAFKLTQPNKVRSLISTFATLNPVGFNRSDGTGYHLVRDVILQLDPVNPQVAARLAGSFKSWRMLEAGRRALAEKALRDIFTTSSLSKDTIEMVSRMLGEDA